MRGTTYGKLAQVRRFPRVGVEREIDGGTSVQLANYVCK
jgi:hypothetical protein